MNIFNKLVSLLLPGLFFWQTGLSQNLPLTDLTSFSTPSSNWILAAMVSADFNKTGIIKSEKGTGILVNTAQQKATDLITRQEFDDIDLELDFMLSKGSSSGIFLQGRYELQLADSWTTKNPAISDLGGIGQRESTTFLGFNGSAPLMNVARAPGLWQHLRIKFRGPKFDSNGLKIKPARFEEVYVNGVLVQEHTDIPAPTKGSAYADEKASGPLMFQAEGPVAFRNIVMRSLSVANTTGRRVLRAVNPIILNPDSKPYILRSYLNFAGKKRTHVVSVGDPVELNYSYDVKQGALLQVWRGTFADVTEMWVERGEPQLAKPLGSLLLLSASPALAVLVDENAAWPDSIAFDDMKNKGYILDKQRIPSFRYEIESYFVSDRISPQSNGESLLRELTISNAPAKLFCRLAATKSIESLGKGLYAMDDRSYYLKIDEKAKPFIRTVQNRQEILLPVGSGTSTIAYSIIF